MDPIPPQPGSPIDPTHAVGRTNTTSTARRELLRGNNLALTDPRRMGKTVWLDMFCAAPGRGLEAIKIDYEGVLSTTDFLARTLTAVRSAAPLAARVRESLAAFFDGWEVGVGPVSVKPALTHRSTLELLVIAVEGLAATTPSGEHLVIAMDEVPVAIDNIATNEGPAAAGQLLQTLRSVRRTHPELRWILCGSVGFHHVLRRCEVTEGVINDLVNLPLGPLETREAHELAHRLMLGIGRRATPVVADHLAERAGRIPFLIHALAHRLEDSGTGDLTVQQVDTAFDDFVHDRDASRAVTHLVTRLEQYGELASRAGALLDIVAVSGPLAEDPADRSLVDDLVDDHYLQRVADGLTWRYDVLRTVWSVRRGLT